ncbi:hypothetical protein CDG77_20250 [Nostoc sp. 'Peltigera membranacea cyanobiont' 213]|uniref:hypothetical protein n=1 Tax=Nostoc sp. 'Peltigera membranacea cyanobiont' 213 TaxID=2014530 RepID=UPI000B957FB5|nr:hypothetical protein [Nostoc sp. 'Peltigera membranacea cyanobiont' 213]OYD89064.1 hypothetical protein CDG77_20250 [Nostoc sp. 'Peltigera membranacea cyanobiont' 213]
MSVWDWQLGCYFGIHGTEATKLTISAFYIANEFYNVLKRKDLWYKLEVFFWIDSAPISDRFPFSSTNQAFRT